MKKYKPTFSLIDELMASDTQPTPQKMRDYQLGLIKSALESIANGTQPGGHDLRMLTDAVNLTETLVAMDKVDDPEGLLPDAVRAIYQANERHKTGKTVRLDGSGLVAVKCIVSSYESALAEFSHKTMVRCHRATERRIHGIRDNSNKLPSDVLVTMID